jgi:hypothetical protein
MNDSIVDEVRRVRAEHAARFNFDLWAIYRDIKEQQARSGLKFVSFADEPKQAPQPPRTALSDSRDNQPLEGMPVNAAR